MHYIQCFLIALSLHNLRRNYSKRYFWYSTNEIHAQILLFVWKLPPTLILYMIYRMYTNKCIKPVHILGWYNSYMCRVCSNFINKASQGWVSLFWKVFFGKNGYTHSASIHLIHSTRFLFLTRVTSSVGAAWACFKGDEFYSTIPMQIGNSVIEIILCIIVRFAYNILCPPNSILWV